jgi:hypothetical protein
LGAVVGGSLASVTLPAPDLSLAGTRDGKAAERAAPTMRALMGKCSNSHFDDQVVPEGAGACQTV